MHRPEIYMTPCRHCRTDLFCGSREVDHVPNAPRDLHLAWHKVNLLRVVCPRKLVGSLAEIYWSAVRCIVLLLILEHLLSFPSSCGVTERRQGCLSFVLVIYFHFVCPRCRRRSHHVTVQVTSVGTQIAHLQTRFLQNVSFDCPFAEWRHPSAHGGPQ